LAHSSSCRGNTIIYKVSATGATENSLYLQIPFLYFSIYSQAKSFGINRFARRNVS
jgi:hypothetical protein